MSYLATPLAAAAPAPAVEAAPGYAATVAAAAGTPASTSAFSWFTDPTQGVIFGWPNGMLLFGFVAIVLFIKGRGR